MLGTPCTRLWHSKTHRLPGLAQPEFATAHITFRFIAATFRSWRGSPAYVAWDPDLNTTTWVLPKSIRPRPGIQSCCSDCRLQGIAGSPSSTAMAERMGFEPMIEFPLYTLSRRAPSATRTPLPLMPVAFRQLFDYTWNSANLSNFWFGIFKKFPEFFQTFLKLAQKLFILGQKSCRFADS